MNPNSLKNLKPFKPGQSGNPTGRPRARPITERYANLAETPIEETERKKLNLPEGATYADALAFAIFERAMKGDIAAIREIREALEGKTEKSLADTQLIDDALDMHGIRHLGTTGSTQTEQKP